MKDLASRALARSTARIAARFRYELKKREAPPLEAPLVRVNTIGEARVESLRFNDLLFLPRDAVEWQVLRRKKCFKR